MSWKSINTIYLICQTDFSQSYRSDISLYSVNNFKEYECWCKSLDMKAVCQGYDVQHISHSNDVIMTLMASQITSICIVCSTVCSGTDQRKHQRSTSLAFVRGIHRWQVNSPHKRPVTQKMFPFDDVINKSRHVEYIPWNINTLLLWLFLSGYIIILSGLVWFIYPYSSELLHWHQIFRGKLALLWPICHVIWYSIYGTSRAFSHYRQVGCDPMVYFTDSWYGKDTWLTAFGYKQVFPRQPRDMWHQSACGLSHLKKPPLL